MSIRAMIVALVLVGTMPVAFSSQDVADQYPGSVLYQKPVEVLPHIWSAIGATAPPTYENAGQTRTLSSGL